MRYVVPIAFLSLLALGGGAVGSAHADELDADAIMKKVLARGTFGWSGTRTGVRMVLKESSGETEERQMVVLGRRDGSEVETLVRFVAPKDVSGMAFLMRDQGGGRSEQYVYLPRLRRTRRITGREREGSFMGSDLSYADLEQRDLEEASHERLDDAKIGDHETYVIRSVPRRDGSSPYAKIKSWIRKSDMVPLRTRFFDSEGERLKTLYTRKARDVEGRPVVVRARVDNHQTGHVTVLIVDEIERKDSFPPGTFTTTALEGG